MPDEKQLVFGSVTLDCNEYLDGPEEEYEADKMRVVISPIRLIYNPNFEGRGRDEYIIMQGCNMYQGCHQLRCVYSEASRNKARERRADRAPVFVPRNTK